MDGILERIFAELGQKPRVIATGGLARMVAADSHYISEIDDLLTLDGLRILFERNRNVRPRGRDSGGVRQLNLEPQILLRSGILMTPPVLQNYFNYFTEIEERFQQRRGSILLLSTLDWALIETWREAGIPLEAVLRGIDTAFDKYESRQKRGRMRRVNGLAWCSQAVMEAAEELREASAGTAEPIDRALRRNGIRARARGNASGDCCRRALMLQRIAHDACAATAARLRELAAEARAAKIATTAAHEMETFERVLTVLEEKLFAALTAAAPEELAGCAQRTCRARTRALSQPDGSRATAPGGAPVRAEAVARALQPSSTQPLLHEPAMKRADLRKLAHATPTRSRSRPDREADLWRRISGADGRQGDVCAADASGRAGARAHHGREARLRNGRAGRDRDCRRRNRVRRAAAHFGVCGGCQYQHANYETQLDFKQADSSRDSSNAAECAARRDRGPGGQAVGVSQSHSPCVRCRRTTLDIAARRSHESVPISECPIAAPLLVRAALSAAEILRERKPAIASQRRFLSFAMRRRMDAGEHLCSRNQRSTGFDQFFAEWKQTRPGADRR